MMLLALSPAISLGLPTTLAARQSSSEGIGEAQSNWFQDTSMVSQFLSTASSLSGQDLVNAASAALANKDNELVHKGVLDAAFVSMLDSDDLAPIQTANATLVTQGTFQFVVDGLTDLATNGAGYSPGQVVTAVEGINAIRCTQVLPAIDVYLQNAALLSLQSIPNAAARPNNC